MIASTVGQGSQDGVGDPLGGELLRRGGVDGWTVQRLGLAQGVDVGGQGRLIALVDHALAAGGQAVDEVAGQAGWTMESRVAGSWGLPAGRASR